jgi:hypothetical protein
LKIEYRGGGRKKVNMRLGVGWVKKIKPKVGEVQICREHIDQEGRILAVNTAHYHDCDSEIIEAAKPLVGKKVITAAELMESGCFTLLAIQPIDGNNASINELL